MNTTDAMSNLEACIAAWKTDAAMSENVVDIFIDDTPDVEDFDIEAEIDRYFRQVEDSYSDADFNAQMGW